MCNACVPKSHPVPCLYVFFFRMMICWSPVSWIFFNISTTKISSESPISHDLASGAMCGATSFKTITQLSSDSSKICTFCHRAIVMQVVKKMSFGGSRRQQRSYNCSQEKDLEMINPLGTFTIHCTVLPTVLHIDGFISTQSPRSH